MILHTGTVSFLRRCLGNNVVLDLWEEEGDETTIMLLFSFSWYQEDASRLYSFGFTSEISDVSVVIATRRREINIKSQS